MGMFERFMEKATLTDDSELDYLEDEGYDYDDFDEVAGEEEAPVSSIRAVSPSEEISRIATCWPRTFEDVAVFADQFRKSIPVILNLSETDKESGQQRIADFALGLAYGLGGQLEQISEDVLLLTPRTMRLEEHRSDNTRRFGH